MNLALGRFLASLVLLPRLTFGSPSQEPVRFQGICDASAAVALDGRTVVVADDESNALRVYSRTSGGSPIRVLDLSRFLAADPKAPEADIEAAARIGDQVYWITSHGRNAEGRYRPNRCQLFATAWRSDSGAPQLQPIGRPYRDLLRDLWADSRLNPFSLRQAASLPPKNPDALNIEGLAATPEGHLLIGFRNPVPRGKALVVPLLNPAEVIRGRRAQFGPPLQLDLGGLGIRSLERVGDTYYLLAGASGAGGTTHLFRWAGGAATPEPVAGLALGGLNPEALAAWIGEDGTVGLFLTSDDGGVKVDKTPCKRLKDPARKSFRGLSVALHDLVTP